MNDVWHELVLFIFAVAIGGVIGAAIHLIVNAR